MSTEVSAESCVSASVINDSLSAQAPADLAFCSNQHRPDGMANDFVPQGPADLVHNAELFGPADCELHGRTENNEYCEFQYIEIVPLDSPKQGENNNRNCCDEVKEEVKQEPEDVCMLL